MIRQDIMTILNGTVTTVFMTLPMMTTSMYVHFVLSLMTECKVTKEQCTEKLCTGGMFITDDILIYFLKWYKMTHAI